MKKLFLLAFATLTLMGCDESSKTLQLSPSSLELYYEEEQQVQVLNEHGTFEWTTANNFYATVNASGRITAGHVGSTVITAKQDKKEGTCSVIVKPKYYLYDTPYFGWGETMTQVKNKLGTPAQTQTNALVYILSEADGIIAMYMFSDGKLSGVAVLLNVKNAVALTYYLVERYQPYSEEDGAYLFINAMAFEKATLGVMMRRVKTSSINAYQVVYAPANQTQNAPARFVTSIKSDVFEFPDNLLYLMD